MSAARLMLDQRAAEKIEKMKLIKDGKKKGGKYTPTAQKLQAAEPVNVASVLHPSKEAPSASRRSETQSRPSRDQVHVYLLFSCDAILKFYLSDVTYG